MPIPPHLFGTRSTSSRKFLALGSGRRQLVVERCAWKSVTLFAGAPGDTSFRTARMTTLLARPSAVWRPAPSQSLAPFSTSFQRGDTADASPPAPRRRISSRRVSRTVVSWSSPRLIGDFHSVLPYGLRIYPWRCLYSPRPVLIIFHPSLRRLSMSVLVFAVIAQATLCERQAFRIV